MTTHLSAARDVRSNGRRRADERHVPDRLALERLVRATSDAGPSQTGLRVSTNSKPPGAGKPERRCCEVATGGAAIRGNHFEVDVFRTPLRQ